MTDHQPLTTALGYASAGLPVLPLHSARDGRCTCGDDCGSPGKHPLTRHGKDDASSDLHQVTAWWARRPWANVGIRPPAGVIVLDVDPRNGGSVALLELTRCHGELPATLVAGTGGGGLHIWLAYAGPTRGQLAPGIDVKTHAGYVVAPPSLHMSGRRYQWMTGTPTAQLLGIAPAPAWVVRMLHPPASSRRVCCAPLGASKPALVGLLRVVINAPQGGRNNALNWAAWRMWQKVRDGHVDELAAVGMLLDAATVAGLGESEARGTIGSARRAVLG